MVANSLWETTTQRHVPPARLSRVTSYEWFGSLATVPIGMVAWGPAAATLGVAGALWLAFVVQLATVAALLAVRDVRRVRADPGAVERVPA